MYFVYIFRNKLNGKVYIGKTKNIRRRKIEHLSKSKRSINHHFYNAIKKYGIDNFEYNTLYECENEEEAYKMETHFIAEYRSNDKNIGYNGTEGGEGLRGINEETRKKMSDNGKLRIGDKNAFYGQHHTEETKQIISQANKGNTYWLGKRHTEDAKFLMSESNKGKRYSPATEFKPGQLPPNTKITMEQAREIRIKHKNGVSYRKLQKEYGVGSSSIWRILTNQSFKDNL